MMALQWGMRNTNLTGVFSQTSDSSIWFQRTFIQLEQYLIVNLIACSTEFLFLYVTVTQLKSHVSALAKNSEVPFICPTCGRLYKKQATLKAHMRMDCNKDGAFACPLCSFKTKRKNNLKVHMGLRHQQAI